MIRQEQTLPEPSLSRSVTDIHQKADLRAIWAAKINPKAIRRPSRKAVNFEPHFEGVDLSGRRRLCTPDPGPWYPDIYIYIYMYICIHIYIYTRISRALRARSILLASIWRPRPSLGGTGSAPRTWTLLLVGRGEELGLTIQADNAG